LLYAEVFAVKKEHTVPISQSSSTDSSIIQSIKHNTTTRTLTTTTIISAGYVSILVSNAAKLFLNQYMDSLSFMQVLEIRVFL